ncbi:MAG: SIMPL domain-containing protein [Pseudomonadales bacterium]|jgi:hypothetical protein|nr:SIMPL domain-containing protein [Pseudomonadales bacterium]MDP6472241.1 SIMPL domain-containing protein [Pseudomonadales bacterium]MDP6826507.1 SIMPL domain-containing protein [Pseudomonadales bacterium]MDP6970315.1 SIMPL domain-containing protein [Pseudomonadales bacterium]|tara:strand:+ start:301 stop:1011 length:711 start_codon:yes stop_codon:yes gene_type:complete
MLNTNAVLLGSVIIALGVAASGYFIGQGFLESRVLERSVTVKGLAEREVRADTAIWPLRIVTAGDDLQELLMRIDAQRSGVLTFLAELGFETQELSLSAPNVTDRHARDFGNRNVRYRYSVEQTITVFTDKVNAVRDAGSGLLELGKAGIVIAQNDYDVRTQYLFNGLNDIRPAMIEQATRSARRVAEKFAADSDSVLGKIRSARQGQFSIQERDSNNPHIKRVRVVSTLEYYLVD